MRVACKLAQRELVRTEAEQEVENPPLPEEARRPQHRTLRAPGPAAAVPPQGERQIHQHLEVAAHPGRWRHQRLHVARGVAQREQVEEQVVVVALEAEAGGQDEMRVPGGLVPVEIDRDHQLEPGQRTFEPRAVRRREHRIAGEGDERADAAFALRLHLFGKGGHRQLAAELGQAANAALPRAEVAAIAHAGGEGHEVGGGRGEHEAAFAVEVAGHRVERDAEPGAKPAELLRADADAAVRHRGGRGSKGAGQVAQRLRRDAGALRHALGRKARRRLPQLREAQGAGHRAVELLREDDLEEREQEEGIGSGPDAQVLVRGRRRLRAPGVHHHQPASALAQFVKPARDASRGHQAPVGGERVRSEHEEEMGPVHVGHRHHQLVAEHLQRGQHLRELIDGGGGEARPRSQRAGEELDAEHGGVGMDGRVADVERHRAAAVLALHLRHALARLGERRLPGHRAPAIAFPPLRLANPIRVVLDVRDGCRLRADVTLAEGIVRVAAHAGDGTALDFEREPADRLAEHAGVQGSRHRRTSSMRSCRRITYMADR